MLFVCLSHGVIVVRAPVRAYFQRGQDKCCTNDHVIYTSRRMIFGLYLEKSLIACKLSVNEDYTQDNEKRKKKRKKNEYSENVAKKKKKKKEEEEEGEEDINK
ncbi:hypothetical protein WN48_09363 [Eufriesea mexicana]|nr:hypothetical protein WN48_09363 [Eufriesea mexicana]